MKSEVIKKMKAFMPFLNEEQRRLYCGFGNLQSRYSKISSVKTAKKGGGRKNPSMIRYGKR